MLFPFHDQVKDLLHVLDTVGLPSPTQAFLFNGEAPCAPRWGCVVE